MIGLLQNYNGDIFYDSKNIKTLDLYSIRKRLISITEQEPILMNDTIKNNITYGVNNYNIDDIVYFCKSLNVDDFINNLPDKLNTIIDEKSSTISGGEKQKISLVRTFIKNADLILLDEPTSALDQYSIDVLKNILINMKTNKIIIFITHNKSILNIADKIIKLKDI